MDTRLKTELSELATLDGLTVAEKDDAMHLVMKLLSISKFFDLVKADLDKIFADGKVDSNDIPRIITLMLKLNNNLPRLLNLKHKLSMSQVKYVVYGSLLYYIFNYQPSFFNGELNVDAFRLLFTNLWSLVEIDPNTIQDLKEALSGCCA